MSPLQRPKLFGETVTVYCENYMEHTDIVCASQETHQVSATGTNRLMLFGETVAVYCENHTEHIDTVCTSQETHYVSTTGTNRLMLFRKTVAVYCENHMEHSVARMQSFSILKKAVPIINGGMR
jgi:thioredoxin-related protein